MFLKDIRRLKLLIDFYKKLVEIHNLFMILEKPYNFIVPFLIPNKLHIKISVREKRENGFVPLFG
ncbi:hypothetical protein CCAN11_360005 [Capnocytophaga canimorsus]|uniref:Uncharacterized protein n=1 Tax=Capnocytophaga canimorsus TaxID=28188 RepID=A0A0B7IM21_9FLAO|nr:hypothetical protein CCAN11_360005 [Capnocytophaga canimorsus]